MDYPKIVKLLRLMKLLTGNVSRTIDQVAAELGITPRTVYRYIDTIREAGFVVNKLYGNVYAIGKVQRGLTDFNRLIYFTEEEAYITAQLIAGIDNNNVLKRDLQRKLASAYDSTSIGNYIDNPANAANVEALADGIKSKHKVLRPDVFRMTGTLKEKIVLKLNSRAKSLLTEEYSLAEKELKREGENWVLRTEIHSLKGAGRFVLGLAADINILEGERLKDYIKSYDKKYVQKLS